MKTQFVTLLTLVVLVACGTTYGLVKKNQALQSAQAENATLVKKLDSAEKRAKISQESVNAVKSSATAMVEQLKKQLRAQLSYYEAHEGAAAATHPVIVAIASAGDFTTTRQVVMNATIPVVLYICSDAIRAACVVQNANVNAAVHQLAGKADFLYVDPVAKGADPVLLGFIQQLGVTTVPSFVLFVPGQDQPQIFSGYFSTAELITRVTNN